MPELSKGAAGDLEVKSGEAAPTVRPNPSRRGKNSPLLHPISFILLITLLVFGSICSFGFVRYDDPENLYANPALNPPKWAQILQAWEKPYQGMYIPVTYTTWGAIAQIAWTKNGLDPRLFHLANLLAHAAASVVVYAILREIGFGYAACVLGAIIFAVNPVQVEAVAWATGLKDVLSGMLGLAALWLYLMAWRRGFWFYLAGTIVFAAALLAKPSTAMIPAIALIIDYWLLKVHWKRSLRRLAAWLVMALAALLVARMVQPTAIRVPVLERAGIVGDALAFYLGHVVAPVKLAVDYGRSPQWLVRQPIIWVNWLVPVVVGLACWRYWRKAAWPAFAIFVVALLPVLGASPFAFQQHSTVADRYLYLGMLGCAILAAAVVRKWPKNGMAAIAVIAVLYGCQSFRHEWVWNDTERLFRQTLAVNPSSDLANNAMGLIAGREAMMRYNPALVDQAIAYFERAVRSNPNSTGLHANLATALLMAGRKQEVEQQLAILRKLKPGITRTDQMENLLSGRGKWFSVDTITQ